MKKAIRLLLVFALCLTLCACGNEKDTVESATPNTVETSEAETMDAKETTDIPEVQNKEPELKTYKLGETVQTDIAALTLDYAQFAIALGTTVGDDLMVAKEYDVQEDFDNPFVAATGHTMVGMQYTIENLDRNTLSLDGSFNGTFITIDYQGKTYIEDTEYGSKGIQDESGNYNWDAYMSINILVEPGKKESYKCCKNIAVDVDSLEDTFYVTFIMPVSGGKTESFTFEVTSEDLEARYAAQQVQEAERANEVCTAIDAIGEVSLASRETITTARNLYDALTYEECVLVTNYNVLEAAEADYAELWAVEKQHILDENSGNFNISTDPIEKVDWYQHKNMPQYIDTRSYIIPYIGVREDGCWICIRYNYTADNWIFWESLTIMADNVKFFKDVGYFNTIRDNSGGKVWEYYDEALDIDSPMDADQLQMLQAIAQSEETIIRFAGDDYGYDLYVTDADKQIIQDTLTLYEALVG